MSRYVIHVIPVDCPDCGVFMLRSNSTGTGFYCKGCGFVADNNAAEVIQASVRKIEEMLLA